MPHPLTRAPAASVTALLLSLAAVGGCGSNDSATPDATASTGGAPTTTAPGEACPATLTDGRDGEAVAAEPSGFLTDTLTWICRYEMDADGSTDRWNQWKLASTPVEVTGADKALVDTLVEGLRPADDAAACTKDLGPRLLISHEVRDGEQAHLVINEFGCRDITVAENVMTDDLSWSAERFRAPRADVDALAALVKSA